MTYKKVKQLGSINAAYIAALIDGEGTITLTRHNKNRQRTIKVDISNGDLKLLKWVKTSVGAGNINLKRPKNKEQAISYTYTIGNRQSLSLLSQILPYLKTYKRKRAEIALKDYIKLTPRNGKYSPKLLVQRERFIQHFFSIPSLKTT